ncbi:hypothetical protein HD597_011670 [Nonomuraea thailandensis]|uniref:Uncharacterized protein n=1 Tax=Nonomuraea thailandensis TaxID=1188745 RepID=A0A9X2GVC5_9ACTN|nr:hypothetical protein [Nonomuraea thailandensis]
MLSGRRGTLRAALERSANAASICLYDELD